jgi:hypothetical protein
VALDDDAADGADRAIPDCHFMKTSTETVRKSGIKWSGCTVKWQSGITLGADGASATRDGESVHGQGNRWSHRDWKRALDEDAGLPDAVQDAVAEPLLAIPPPPRASPPGNRSTGPIKHLLL